MLRDILIVIGAAFFLLIFAVGCYWYYQHTTAHDRAEVDKAEQLLKRWESEKAKTTTTAETASPQAPAEDQSTTAEKSISDTINTVPKLEKNGDISSVHSEPAERANETETRVSPHGFGPYPDVPQGFIDAVGKPVWFHSDEVLRQRPARREVELMQRVMVKLWKQGRTDVEAAFMDGDKVIVHYKNRAYVRYDTYKDFNGEDVTYISSWRSGSAKAPEVIPGTVFPPLMKKENVDPNIELIDLDSDPGIDPYEFLGLN